MKIARMACVVLPLMALGACQTSDGSGPSANQVVGGLGGAAAGGLIGSQIGQGTGNIIATAAGVAIGGLIGSEIGRALEPADRNYAQQTAYEGLSGGQQSTWYNPDSGNRGTFTPTRTYSQGNTACRDYRQEIYIDGEMHESYGTACQRSDGSWEVVS